MTARKVAVIGAGAAGLCAAKHLLAKGIEVVIYEMGTRIGGLEPEIACLRLATLCMGLNAEQDPPTQAFGTQLFQQLPGALCNGFDGIGGKMREIRENLQHNSKLFRIAQLTRHARKRL